MSLSPEGSRSWVLPRWAVAAGMAVALALSACGGDDDWSVSEVCPAADEFVGDTTSGQTSAQEVKRTQEVALGIARAALADIQEQQSQGRPVTVYKAETPGADPIPTYAYGVPPEGIAEGQTVVALELTDQFFVRYQRPSVDAQPGLSLTASFLIPDDLSGSKPTPEDFAAAVDPAKLQPEDVTFGYGLNTDASDVDACGGTAIIITGPQGKEVVREANRDLGELRGPIKLDVVLDTAQKVRQAASATVA